jgi:hypothetical protein
MADSNVVKSMITGKAVFSVLTTTDFYKGKDTGNYKLTVALDDESAEYLAKAGVRLKEYEGTFQRGFKTKHQIVVKDMDDNPFEGEIPRGSEVRVLYALGKDNPEWGVPVYMNQVRVVSVATASTVPEEF